MTKKKIIRGPAIACPHCNSTTEIRSSREIAPMTRDVYYRCHDDECGHLFGAQLSITHTVVPSAKPNPAVVLPISQHAPAARKAAANDDTRVPIPANDDDREAREAPVTGPS